MGMRARVLTTALVLGVLGGGPPTAAGEVVLTHPDAAWSLVLRLPPSFQAGPPRSSHEGSAVAVTAADTDAGMLLHARIEPAGPAADARQRRERAFKRATGASPAIRDLRRHERGERALLEYTVVAQAGVSLTRRHLGLWIHLDGLCVEIEATLAP
jgi:hypothetical protein